MYATKGGKQASCPGSGKFSEFEKIPDERDDSTREYQEIVRNFEKFTVEQDDSHLTFKTLYRAGRLLSRCYFRWCLLSW
jgi:hypothetical protein